MPLPSKHTVFWSPLEYFIATFLRLVYNNMRLIRRFTSYCIIRSISNNGNVVGRLELQFASASTSYVKITSFIESITSLALIKNFGKTFSFESLFHTAWRWRKFSPQPEFLLPIITFWVSLSKGRHAYFLLYLISVYSIWKASILNNLFGEGSIHLLSQMFFHIG